MSHCVVCEQACHGMGCGTCMGQGTEASGPVPKETKIAHSAQRVSRDDSVALFIGQLYSLVWTVEGVVVEMLVWDPAQCLSMRGTWTPDRAWCWLVQLLRRLHAGAVETCEAVGRRRAEVYLRRLQRECGDGTFNIGTSYNGIYLHRPISHATWVDASLQMPDIQFTRFVSRPTLPPASLSLQQP